MKRVAVIGAGWAGLAAACELTAAGLAPVVFEAGRVPGGRARSVEIDGRTVDNGQHILLGAYRDTLALMGQVGADPTTLFERQPLQIVDNTGFRLALSGWPAPLNVAWGLLTARPVGWQEKLATALWMDGLKRRRFVLDRDQSVADWLDAAGQNGVLRRHLWEPLCLAALNTPVERASAQLFAHVLRDSLGSPQREATDLLLPRVPLGELLPEPAVAWLTAHGAELRFGHRVRHLIADTEGVHLDDQPFDAAIVAVAPQHVGALWPSAACHDDYEPIATVYLEYTEAPRLSFPLYNRLGGLAQWVVGRGAGCLACVLSGHGDWETLDDDRLATSLRDELDFGQPTWWRVIREKRATFAARPNLPRTDGSTGNPRLALAGDYTWGDYPATLEGGVRSGRRAAQAILKS